MHRIVAAYVGGVLTMAAVGFGLERAAFGPSLPPPPCPHAARAEAAEALARRCSDRLIEQDEVILGLRAELDAARREQTAVRPADVPAADRIPPTLLPER